MRRTETSREGASSKVVAASMTSSRVTERKSMLPRAAAVKASVAAESKIELNQIKRVKWINVKRGCGEKEIRMRKIHKKAGPNHIIDTLS